MSEKGIKYYLPAYLQFTVRDYHGSDSIPDGLVLTLTLPTEMDVVMSALDARRYRIDTDMPTIDWNDHHQTRLRDMDQSVHRFVERYGQFTGAQGRVILHFLEHMRDEYGEDFFNNEPGVAIERYWFQFA